jgi:RNA polymerase sigma-70 factor (ECF subfamily)
VGYPATRWSLVLAASGSDEHGRRAFDELCRAYWRPLYAFARREGRSPADAEEAVQGFVLSLIERVGLSGVDPERGRFRNYLLGAFRHYLADAHDRATASKRGGGWERVDADVEVVERMLAGDEDTQAPIELTFDRAWAFTLLRRCGDELRREYEAKGRSRLWQELRSRLTDSGDALASPLQLEALGMSRNAFNVAVHRARKKFGQRLREEVRDTLHDPTDADVAAELQHLVRLCADLRVPL